jgi:cystathionine beta-synthase
MQSYGFTQVSDETTVADVVGHKDRLAACHLVHVHPSDTVRDAIQIMTKYGVSRGCRLTSAEPPVVIGGWSRTSGRLLLEQVFGGWREHDRSVREVSAGHHLV